MADAPEPKWVVGLVGDICSGKSTVARHLVQLGAIHFDADRCVHELYREPAVRDEVVRHFGIAVLGSDGMVDRRKLGEIVFATPERLRKLTEEIVYPRTGQKLQEAIESFRKADAAQRVLLLDAPTLFEAKRAELCDYILFVTAPLALRQQWAASTRGWSAEEIERREQMMLPTQDKIERSNRILQNTGSVDALLTQVDACWVYFQETVPSRSR